ncbi:MAG: biopolymer transporter ExbD [Candidatus Lindowbacteria bacterium]|nr:biopolymer transporter ExbD [Candidatus Lindowbacteria bacterium]
MRFKYAAYEEKQVNVDMTPIIDIVFNLLLFFLLSSSYVQHEVIDIKLPEATSSKTAEAELNMIEIRKDQTIFIQGDEVAFEDLRPALARLYPKEDLAKPLLVRADELAYHGHVVAILDAARDLGVAQLNIETLPPERATGN